MKHTFSLALCLLLFACGSVLAQAPAPTQRIRGDVVALDILHHALGLRVLHDGLAALSGEVIHLFDSPAAALGVASRPILVMFRAFALGLIFG